MGCMNDRGGGRNSRLVLWAAAPLGWCAAWGWWWPAAWGWVVASHALLFTGLRLLGQGWRRQGLAGLLFGLGLHAHGHGWLYATLVEQAHAARLWALLGGGLVVFYLALFTAAAVAMQAWWVARLQLGLGASTLVFAVAWTGAEALRSLPWNGMTGLSLGYAVLDTPALGWLPLLGVYGASLMVLWWSAACGALCLQPRLQWRGWVLSGVLLWGVGALALQVPWTAPLAGAPAWRYHLLGAATQQGPPPVRERAWLQRLTAATADLVLTPETAMPRPYGQWAPGGASALQTHSTQGNSHLFVGTLAEGPGGLYNTVLQFNPAGVVARHDKQALTPVGEYTPGAMAWYAQGLRVPYRDLLPGGAAQSLWVRTVRTAGALRPAATVGVLVCQEDMVSRWAVALAPQVGVWLAPGNLGWFNDHRAHAMRLQAARARAAETGRPLLKADLQGHTVHVDHRGRVRAQAVPGGDLQGEVVPHAGLTPFVRWGAGIWWVFAVGLLGCWGWRLRVLSQRVASVG